MARAQIQIKTEDGTCPAYVFQPSGQGPWPSVLFYMDGIGIRPAMFEMGERLAAAGYHVLLPDLFYRGGPYEPQDPAKIFGDPAVRQAWVAKHIGVTTIAHVMRDTKAFLAYFGDSKVGVTGYCMGGRMSLAAAGTFGDRIAAAAAYHPGNLATDAPDSPHLLAPQMKAQVYVGGASDDPSFPEEQKQRLADALSAAHVDHIIETYPAKHGWVPSDTPVHDPACAERHWQTLLGLFDRTLRQ